MSFRLFQNEYLFQYLRGRIEELKNRIKDLSEYDIKIFDRDTQLNGMLSKAMLVPISIDEGGIHTTNGNKAERLTDQEFYDRGARPTHDGVFRTSTITFHIPFSGSSELFELSPSNTLMWTMLADIRGNSLLLNYEIRNHDPEHLRVQFKGDLDRIKQILTNQKVELDRHNVQFYSELKSAYEARLETMKKTTDFSKALGYPAMDADTAATQVAGTSKDASPIESPSLLLDDGRFRVFIAYAQGSAEHNGKVQSLAAKLRDDGVEAHGDFYEPNPSEGWPNWMKNQIQDADHVLVVCDKAYKEKLESKDTSKGKGTKWEGAIITQAIYDAGSQNRKFIAVFFDAGDEKFVPSFLRPWTFYNVNNPKEYENLFAVLTDQVVPPPSVGPLKKLSLTRPAPLEHKNESRELPREISVQIVPRTSKSASMVVVKNVGSEEVFDLELEFKALPSDEHLLFIAPTPDELFPVKGLTPESQVSFRYSGAADGPEFAEITLKWKDARGKEKHRMWRLDI
jgi:hypothetical protein